MKRISTFIYVFLILAIYITGNRSAYAAAPIIVGIQLNTPPNVIPGITKHFKVCKDIPFYLKSENISPSKPTTSPIYQWDNIDSSITVVGSPVITPKAAGRWVATIKYYNVATSSFIEAKDTIYITYYPSVPFQITTVTGTPITAANITICGDADSTIGATAGFNEYKWYKEVTTPIIGTAQFLTITTAMLQSTESNKSFFVTAKDGNSCNASAQIYIRRTAPIPIDIGGPYTSCNNAKITISSPSSPTSTTLYSYAWSLGPTKISTLQSISVNVAGTYSLKITSIFGCSATDNTTLTTGAGAGLSVSADTSICFGTSVQLKASMPGNASYLWNGPDVSNVSGPEIVVSPQPQGAYTYTVSGTSNQGCPGQKSVKVTVFPPNTNPYFTLSAGNDTIICSNTTAQLNTSVSSVYPATYTWAWSPATNLNSTTIQNPVVTPVTTGLINYQVIATDNRGCKKTSSVNVNILNGVSLTTNFTDTTVCIGKQVLIKATAVGGNGIYTYLFSPSNATVSTNTMYVQAGKNKAIYTVNAKDGKGCISNSVPVSVQGYLPVADISDHNTITGVKNTPVTLSAHTGSTNTSDWYSIPGPSFLASGPEYIATVDDTIYVIVTDTNGCKNNDTVSVLFFEGNPYLIYIPNVFSPEASNEENQTLKVYGFLIQETDFNFKIFNQWGQLVYHTNSFKEASKTGWSGEIKGNDARQSNSVYTYTLDGKFYDGTEFQRTGTATLLQ